MVGLGYVDLPLDVKFVNKSRTIGFDLSHTKVESYRRCIDPAGEIYGSEIFMASIANNKS